MLSGTPEQLVLMVVAERLSSKLLDRLPQTHPLPKLEWLEKGLYRSVGRFTVYGVSLRHLRLTQEAALDPLPDRPAREGPKQPAVCSSDLSRSPPEPICTSNMTISADLPSISS